MKVNPFIDAFHWLADPRLVILGYWALLLASLWLLFVNWRTDPMQRSVRHLTIWAMRVLIGAMWYQGTTWKLPLPVSDAFAHWLGESGKHASFQWLADLVNQVMIPNLPVIGTFIYFLELGLAVSLTLGLFTRLFALVAAGQAAFLWLTLYRAEAEWAWNYIFLLLIHVAFILLAAGRSLGADAILRRRVGVGMNVDDAPKGLLGLVT